MRPRAALMRTWSGRAGPPWPLLVTLLTALLTLLPSAGRASFIAEEFSDQFATERFNHMVVDDNTGRVYVGAVNRLYQLSPDLELKISVKTGPEDDDPECSPANECPAYVVKRLTNNVNKALVIDKTHGTLIACGSLFQGRCQVRNLHNISSINLEVEEAVVANNETASTVAFIAPGPPRPPETHVLYVGVTFTGGARAPYRNEVPAVSSRSLDLDRMFSISELAVTTGTRMSINSLARERYFINYVHGFGSNGFSYFLTTQMRRSTEMSPYISKLVRVCQDDPHYYSYTEIPIDCIDDKGTKYNLAQAAHVATAGSDVATKLGITAQDDVLYAVFSVSERSEGENSDKPTNKSALCVYSLKDIRHKFTRNIMECYRGNVDRGLEFISPGKKCVSTKFELLETVGEDFCGMDVNTPIGGSMAVTAVAVLTVDTLLTSVAATSTGDFTVVFTGTDTGHVKKIVVEPVPDGKVAAVEYGDLTVQQNSRVQADLRFDARRQHLYVMTEKKVSKVKVQECHLYSTCSECLTAKDPYCGWCSLENKCSVRTSCQDAAKDTLYWINYKTDRCTTIDSVTPHQLQATTARTLTLTINNLPKVKPEGRFLCAFTLMGKTLPTNATQTGQDTLTCTTPPTDQLPPIPSGQRAITAKLSVRMSPGPGFEATDFVATDFGFYDCNRYTQCGQCVSAPFPCDWCVDGHRCTHDTAENCRNDILVTGVKRIGPSIRSGPGFCPRINTTIEGDVELLVPSGSQRAVVVRVENIPRLIAQGRFMCQFNIEGRVISAGASPLGSNIYCQEMEFSYNAKRPNTTAAFAVIWNGNKPLDNPKNVHVLVYRCSEMADNCGECLALEPRFHCGWCQTTGQCQIRDQCAADNWLDRDQPCPNPQVHEFSPKSGPYEGGTNITITGINLGKDFGDIYDQVTVAGVPCRPIESLYVKTRQIVCEVDGPGTREYLSGPVLVRVASYQAKSEQNYRFVDPRIERIAPERGPRSGGTRLRIFGLHMDAGLLIRAQINELPCRVLETASTYAVCVTSAAAYTTEGRLSMTFDRSKRLLAGQTYTYVDDPQVLEVTSGPNTQYKVPKGVPSGGIRVSVRGRNLQHVQEPRMAVQHAGREYLSEPCKVLTDELMTCMTPLIPAFLDPDSIRPEKPELLDYGFVMDNVRSVQNISTHGGNGKFQLFPDPVYMPFRDEDGIKYYKSDYLTINGRNLNWACKDTDVTVHIGTAFCNVTSLSRNQLTCKPPSKAPMAIGSDGQPTDRQLPHVVVRIGNRLNYTIGRLSYAAAAVGGGALPQDVIIGVVVGGAVLLLLVFVILVLYRRKSSESSRVLKNMQEQMDVLELRVAAECKEAFAELQTEMTDLTSDITGFGIPFLEYRAYCMKILFPSQEDHPVLQWNNRPDLQRREKGLRLFGQLIINKTFLLLFIRTLESNRYFSMRDRVNVASLIMVTLQCRMEYCTDILKTLLSELIEKCTECNGSHPKLLLRRTESVAEKMLSSWFTFLLYKFLRECAGEPLYLLYRAIKQQVDKGPVDAVTSEARYSLSEEKLIRQQIDFTYMTVYVSMPPQTIYVSGLDPHQDNADIPVRVLNTDTITQTKEKSLDYIYRSTPFSLRPRKEDLDLEWRTGNSGRLILNDEDSTIKLEAGWKKLNTLAYYRVPDGALLTLVPKQSSLYNLSILSEKSDKSHKYETLNLTKYGAQSPPLSRAMSPTNQENGIKVWHLVRHSESEQRDGERGNKMVSEIYLTRLLATKGTLQKFMDDLFETIFSTAHRGSALPLAIKYMFDFLDDQALQHGIVDLDTVHTWKSNSLPLRFWVNLIKNPNFVFDIHKSNIVDSCLSVVAQTFMDSCSTSDNKLGKDSPSSKLLYAKDIPVYKEWVTKYYDDIKMMPAISDQDMNAMLAEESRLHQQEFNTNCALHELYAYAVKYSDQLMANLEEDEFSSRQRLALKLEQVHKIMAGEPDP
ncbi:plexin-A2-like [Pollicipes pollicipes]|uniref:plexin-A2-like n=1 Tax=Pollicipes pollicipes TaxID=41117 RepID=UPI0018854C87|nr:plexin-A2-like [Pollicipes pollicipes]